MSAPATPTAAQHALAIVNAIVITREMADNEVPSSTTHCDMGEPETGFRLTWAID